VTDKCQGCHFKENNNLGPGIFSTYSTDENRVTCSVMAVIRSLSLDRMDRLLSAMVEQPGEFALIEFKPQPSRGGKGVPDYHIVSNARLLVETKVKRGALDKDQIGRHLARLDKTRSVDGHQYLVLLTPDASDPRHSLGISDPRLTWCSFSSLDQAIDELLADEIGLISEREAFLLRELQKMLAREGLTVPPRNTVVVAARLAWPTYQQLGGYICQPERAFENVTYLAFYAERQIQPIVPKVKQICDNVVFHRGLGKDDIGKIVNLALESGAYEEGAVHKVFVLTGPDDPETVRLQHPVVNDLPSAYTMGQRYVRLDALKSAQTTSELSRL
jgi:hypothetical protein